MTFPSPAHQISIVQNPTRVRVTVAGRVVADTTRALRLREGSLRPVLYIPREDADMGALVRTDHTTHCPFKGDACYFSIPADSGRAENAVWSYEQPYPAVAAIAGHLAFYPERVDAIENLPR